MSIIDRIRSRIRAESVDRNKVYHNIVRIAWYPKRGELHFYEYKNGRYIAHRESPLQDVKSIAVAADAKGEINPQIVELTRSEQVLNIKPSDLRVTDQYVTIDQPM